MIWWFHPFPAAAAPGPVAAPVVPAGCPRIRLAVAALLCGLAVIETFGAAPPTPRERLSPPRRARTVPVQAIKAPVNPLPSEAESAAVTKFSFFVYGDTRGRRDGKETQYEHSLVVDSMTETAKTINLTEFPIRFVLQTGDAVIDGRDPRQWNASFVGIINRITRNLGVPYFLAPGNHDVTSAGELHSTNRAIGLRNYLAAVSNLIPNDHTKRRLTDYPTYAFGYGNSFFFALDSNIAHDPVQFAWVTNQLAGLDRTRYRHLFAFFHHPPFSSGPHGGSKVETPAKDLRQQYLPLFRQHHFSAIFTGHEHFFEHWVERYQDPDGSKFRLDHIVTGGGGAPLYSFEGEPDLTAYLATNATPKVALDHLVKPGPAKGDNPYHFVVVRVNGDELKLEVIGVDWGKDYKPYRSRTAILGDP